MKHVIIDLEATCWEKNSFRDRMEAIEIGAVRLPSAAGPPGSEFNEFIRPVKEPVLEFCKSLTGIRQEDIDQADPFPDVFFRFLKWAGPPPLRICSWGDYDIEQLKRDSARYGMVWPPFLNDHVNLKAELAAQDGRKPCGMRKALDRLGLPLEGRYHRGIDDARNIARLARRILPWIAAKRSSPEA